MFPPDSCGNRTDALKLLWDVSHSNSFAGCTINLSPQSIEELQDNSHLVFWAQGMPNEQRFKVGLGASIDGPDIKVIVSTLSSGGQISIPLTSLTSRDIDKSQIRILIIAFENQLSEEGEICISDIGFGSP